MYRIFLPADIFKTTAPISVNLHVSTKKLMIFLEKIMMEGLLKILKNAVVDQKSLITIFFMIPNPKEGHNDM